LRIGKRAITFPPLFKGLLEQPHDLRVSAWWHQGPPEMKLFPPHLAFHIHPRKKDFSYRISINLDALDEVELTLFLEEAGSVTRILEVKLADDQKESVRKSLETVE
jgi:hypothetical protein